MTKSKLFAIITCAALSVCSLTACNNSSTSSSSVAQSAYEKHECQDITFEIPSELKEDNETDNYYCLSKNEQDNNYICVSPAEYYDKCDNESIKNSKETYKTTAKQFKATIEFQDEGKIFVKDREGFFIKSKYSSEENANLNGLEEISLFFNIKNKESDDLDYTDKENHTIIVNFCGKYATKEQMQHFIDSIDFKDR